ncbi:hypothetical protein [Actinoplanes sp. TFC3]|uniref:hypothetical protein n=1 Tax=Actinoplanes sp. TFC3 TaxID=1710355 RepID=UPI0008325A62|nr:hypothetical protein [Actinoplanes sp. TFC3]
MAVFLLLVASLITGMVLLIRRARQRRRDRLGIVTPFVSPEVCRRRRIKWISGSLAALLFLGGGGLAFQRWYTSMRWNQEREKDKVWFAEQQGMASWSGARSVIDAQARALVAGDEQAFLAAVDPGQPQLQAEYQRLYDSMRALGVTGWDYFPDFVPVEGFGHSEIEAHLTVPYCLHVLKCPSKEPAYEPSSPDVPTIKQMLKLDKRNGVYKIVGLTQKGENQPPWQSTNLTFATGQRVVVAAPPSQRARLQEVTAAADKAALEADEFARYTGARPAKYHLYLAGDKEWRSTWYGGEKASYAVGYAHQTGVVGTDVVLEMSEVGGGEELATTLRHEFGHVVTLQGVPAGTDVVLDLDSWLKEGIAEYIGVLPRTKLSNGRVAALKGRTIPRDMRLDALGDHAGDDEANELYGYGYLAVNCMVGKYGETKMMKFVNGVLRQDLGSDEAAEKAFGVSYTQLNTACTGYFKTVVNGS